MRERGMILNENDAGLSGVSYQRGLRFGGAGMLAAQLRRLLLAAVLGVAGTRAGVEGIACRGGAKVWDGPLVVEGAM